MYSALLGEIVRTGLVFLGAAFLVVGITALAALFALPAGLPQDRNDTWTTVILPSGGSASSPYLWGENGSNAQFTIRWQSTEPVRLLLKAWNGPWPCPVDGCSPATVVASWGPASSGNWESSGPTQYPYWVVANTSFSGSVAVSVHASGTAGVTSGASALQTLIGTVAGLLVVAVGVVALFLGLFLRRNPYGPPPAQPPRDAEGVDATYPREPPPRSPRTD
jgi:hypothetical protein